MGQAVEVGAELEPLVKHVTQEKINMFEACGLRGEHGGFHTDPDAAMKTIGLATPIASGRVQLSYVTEAQRRFFGPDLFDSHGSIDLRFVKPVVDGDTVTVHGKVVSVDEGSDGKSVAVDVWVENQNGDRTSMGTATAVLPKS